VGALIFRRSRSGAREILLVERAGRPLQGYWSLPGGLLESGETLEQAVRREVREETGLRVEVVRFFEIFERVILDQRGRAEYHYLLIDYICRVAGGKLRPASDVSGAAWVRRARLGDYRITEGTRAVIERAFRARGKRT
jgi:ADP-ribose pyrophosphatase YjhB (NUDIX family)